MKYAKVDWKKNFQHWRFVVLACVLELNPRIRVKGRSSLKSDKEAAGGRNREALASLCSRPRLFLRRLNASMLLHYAEGRKDD